MSVLSIREMYSVAGQQLLSGDAPKAREIYRRIVAQDPGEPYALHLLGRSEAACGNFQEALLALHRSLVACAPDNQQLASATWNQIGECLRKQARHEDAVDAYEHALEHDPRSVDALCNMGIALRLNGDIDEAQKRLAEAIALKPDKAIAHNGMGNVLRAMGRNADAAEAFRKALLHNPNLFEGHNNLANTLRDLGRPNDAIQAYERALALRPDTIEVLVNLRHAAAQVFDTSRQEWAARRLAHLTARQLDRGETATEGVLSCSLRGGDSHTVRRVASSRVRKAKPAPRTRGTIASASDGRIRLGYMIDDATNRPAWRRLAFLVGHHDRRRFDLRIYRTGVPSTQPGSCQIAFDIAELHGSDDLRAATRIAEDDLDVLIDLVGQEPGGRLGILAHRPAARQLIWSHLDLSSGMDAVDGFVTDPVSVPPNMAHCFTERLLYLPPAQRVLGATEMDAVLDREGEESAACVAETGVTFAILGRPLRFSEEIVAAWMSILEQIDGGALVFNRMNPCTLDNLRAFAEKRGIDGARLKVAPRQATRSLQLRQLRKADIALDTAPQSSGAAVLDALSVGLPVVTLAGSLPTERTGSSLLAAFNQQDSATGSIADYVARAVTLARIAVARLDPPLLLNASVTCSIADSLRLLEDELSDLARTPGTETNHSTEMGMPGYSKRDASILHVPLLEPSRTL